MAQVPILKPDSDFVIELKALGATTLNQCFQCGTCSVVCPHTPQEEAFPRKEMVWSQWGLKDRLVADPDLWACYGCGDCTALCPRGADPAGTMAALRTYAVNHHSLPRIVRPAFTSPRYLPLLMLLPIVVFLVGFALGGKWDFPAGPIEYAHFIHEHTIDLVAALAMGPTTLLLLWSLVRLYRGMSLHLTAAKPQAASPLAPLPALRATVSEVFGHRRFAACETERPRYGQHLLVFFGFLLLLFATLGRAYYHYLFHYNLELVLSNPVKIAGNLGGILVLTAGLAMIYRRLSRVPGLGRSTYFDWFFLVVLVLTGLTGFFTEFARLVNIGDAAYIVYLVHLMCVFMLLVYLPFSKFAHIIYRTVGLYFAARIGRTSARTAPLPKSAPGAPGIQAAAGRR